MLVPKCCRNCDHFWGYCELNVVLPIKTGFCKKQSPIFSRANEVYIIEEDLRISKGMLK